MTYRNIFKYTFPALAPFILAGCSDNLPFPNGENHRLPLALSAEYPSATRASDAGFEDGDEMGVYVLYYADGEVGSITDSDIHASNVRFHFHGTDNSWSGAGDIYWKDGSTPADIIAYYPYSSGINSPKSMPFSVSRHQETDGSETIPGGYEGSDLLYGAVRKQMPTNGKVQLTLNHILAGVRVTLREGSGFASGEWDSLEKDVVIPCTVLGGYVNLADGSVRVGSTSPETIVPVKYGADYRAVVFPQSVSSGVTLLSITVDGAGYSLTKQTEMTFAGGRLHTFTVTVDKKSAGNYEFTLSDEAIVQWIDEVEFRDGVIRPYTTVDVPERGSLKNIVIDKGLSYKEIANLKLTGEIDENDFLFIRDEMTSLKALNLKDARVYDNDRPDVIPANAMYCKSTLTKIVFPERLKTIGSSAFHQTGLMGDLIIPEGVEKIGEGISPDDNGSYFNGFDTNYGAFSSCCNLSGNLSLPSSLTHIEHDAFTQDKFEGSLILPDRLKFIGSNSFYGCNFTGELRIPESIEYIGAGAFGATNFTGSLVIPSGIEVIRESSFRDAGFTGSLLLPAGLMEIKRHAFDGCGFKGELLLPESVLTLGDYAFSNTRISDIVFPKSLTSIGKGCFSNCQYLNGRIEIPENVNRINEYTFAGDLLLSEIKLHENVKFVGGAAFMGVYNLKEISIANPEPPSISIVQEMDPNNGNQIYFADPFYGISMANVTLKVPDSARDAYSRSEIWQNFGRHATINGFGCRPERICALNKTHREDIIVDGDGAWEISHLPSWCKVSVSAGNGKTQLSLDVMELPKGSPDREDYVEFRLKGTDITARCGVTQKDYEYMEDECITLRKATRGTGIDILFVGDGFDAEAIADGEYLKLVEEQADAFFGIEPYSTYKDYFNVYACISLSQETDVNTTSTHKNTRFMTRFDNGTGCSERGLACSNADEVFDYAVAHSPLSGEKMSQSLIIMALNSDQYGSVTTLTENGSAIAIVGRSGDPYPMDTRGILQHEACGHAFGKLAEERIVENKYITGYEKLQISYMHSRGWYKNISLTGKINEVEWSEMVFNPRYSNKVDVFEGGYGVTRGVYRAEINSCMNYGIPYFSAPARLDIMRRILDYSGEGFTMDKFYETDSDEWGATASTRAAMPPASDAYVNSGMHHPVRIVKSKKY